MNKCPYYDEKYRKRKKRKEAKEAKEAEEKEFYFRVMALLQLDKTALREKYTTYFHEQATKAFLDNAANRLLIQDLFRTFVVKELLIGEGE